MGCIKDIHQKLSIKTKKKIVQWQPSNHIMTLTKKASSPKLISHTVQLFQHFIVSKIHHIRHRGIAFQ